MSAGPLVVVTQPYVPAYRVPLFESVREKLSRQGIRFLVAAGHPVGAQAARGDRESPAWRIDIRSKGVHLGGRTVEWRALPSDLQPDVLVSELEALNNLAWMRSFGRRKLVLWGHGRPYVNDAGALSDRIEWTLARRADAVMTYADGGRDYLVENGKLDPDSVVAIGNSTDSASLRAAYKAVDAAEMEHLLRRWPRAPRALFVGGLDAAKRIDFLIDAAIAARQMDPRFTLIVVGMGEMQDALSRAGDAIEHIPAARGVELARLGHVVQAIWMPGRIGLVAVDALALGLPIFSTSYRYHAPEAEFLRAGERITLPDDPPAFAERALSLMAEELVGNRILRSDIPTIDSVSQNFADVVIKVLDR
ncbi:glycosyltransferase [Microbacterium testaceum StLB037]|uniref:D-inositol 3-phosphate glycosyltransferase n=1 Tax=Microbacterium testaceum (strain StLB037) TaxID=979556 RepID=E8NFF0_MICTS|nr:glycosyltransferase [Microbacterium testaceum]BAJ75223.1 glycosyltransferase [Microbacterium testaceum StLB037]